MRDWFLTAEEASDWARAVFDALGAAPKDLLAVLGDTATSEWIGEGIEPEGENDDWPAWCATRALTGVDREVSLTVSMDYAAFDEDDSPIADRYVVELGVIFGLDPRQQLPAALRRATAAWTRCARDPSWATEALPYPNREEAPGAIVGLFKLGAIKEFDPKGIWVVLRSAPFSLASRSGLSAATTSALRSMLPLTRDWMSAAHLVRGAVFGVPPSVDIPTIIGWCGEALLWQREGARRCLIWSPAWTSPYDFSEGDDGFVEVKTTDFAGGEFHFSSEEVALALRSRARYSFVHVRIDTTVAGAIQDALLGPPVLEDSEEDAWGPEGVRLADAIGRDAKYVRDRWPPVRDILFGLADSAIVEEGDPLAWLVPVAQQMLSRRAGLVLPAPVVS